MKTKLGLLLLGIAMCFVMIPIVANAEEPYKLDFYVGGELVYEVSVAANSSYDPLTVDLDDFNKVTEDRKNEYISMYDHIASWEDNEGRVYYSSASDNTVTVTSDMTFTATEIMCDISYEEYGTGRSMGGLGGIVVGENRQLEDARTEYVPEGKVLDYWDYNGTHYNAGDNFTFTQNVTLYAVWKDAPAVDPAKVITDITVSGIQAPSSGGTPQMGDDFKTALSFNNSNIEVVEAYWKYNNTSTSYTIENGYFRADTDYRLIIEIKTINGYTFANNGRLIIRNNEGMLDRTGYVAYCEYDNRVVAGSDCADREILCLPFTTKSLASALPVLHTYWSADGTLNWYSVDGACDYWLRVKKSGRETDDIAEALTGTSVSLEDKMEESNLDSGSYTVKLHARDASSTAVSEVHQFSYNYTKPTPVLPDMSGVSISYGTLSWAAVTGAAKYVITIDGTSYDISNSVTSYDLNQKMQDLGLAGGDYIIKIKAVDGSGNNLTNESSRTYTYHVHAFTCEVVHNDYLKSAADCTNAAVYYKSCSCGLKSTNEADVFTSGTALGHSFSGGTCSVCGEPDPAPGPAPGPAPEPEPQVNYIDPLDEMLDDAIENGSTATIYWDKGDALPNHIMQKLFNNPTLSLDFKFTYEGVEHEVYIGPGQATNDDIEWYGPLWLLEKYGDKKAESAVHGVYTIVKNDTLNKLAVKFNTTVDELMRLNPYIKDNHWIYPGNKLNY